MISLPFMATTDTDHGFEWVVNESGFEAEVEEHAPPAPDAAPPPARVRELWHLPRRLTLLYIILPTTLKPVRTLVGQWRDFSWAPDGRLLLFKESEVFLLDEAANPLGPQASQLLEQNCGHMLFKPLSD